MKKGLCNSSFITGEEGMDLETDTEKDIENETEYEELDDPVKFLKSNLKGVKKLNYEQLNELVRKYQLSDSPEEKKILIQEIYEGVIYLFLKNCKIYKLGHSEYGDAFSNFYFELVKAVNNFDCNRKDKNGKPIKFTTYLQNYMVTSISKTMSDTQIVHKPVEVRRKLRKEKQEQSDPLLNNLDIIYENMYDTKEEFSSAISSLIEDKDIIESSQFETVKKREIESIISYVCHTEDILNSLERTIIFYKFGLNGAKKTLNEIAYILKIQGYTNYTDKHVKYHLDKALKKIRNFFNDVDIKIITDIL